MELKVVEIIFMSDASYIFQICEDFKILKCLPSLRCEVKNNLQFLPDYVRSRIGELLGEKKISPYFGWQCECVPRYGTAVRWKPVVQRQQDDIKNGSSKSERAAAAAEEERDELTG